VITWFQNRRAKQKRDIEEMKNDIKTVCFDLLEVVNITILNKRHSIVRSMGVVYPEWRGFP